MTPIWDSTRGTRSMTSFTQWAPRLRSILRIILALLFMEHGLMKLFGFPAAQPGVPNPLPALLIAAAWIEIIGGGLLALGLFTRPVALLCAGEMAVAYFIVHSRQQFWPALNGGELAIIYCFGFLYLAAAGPGPWSFDSHFRATETERTSDDRTGAGA